MGSSLATSRSNCRQVVDLFVNTLAIMYKHQWSLSSCYDAESMQSEPPSNAGGYQAQVCGLRLPYAYKRTNVANRLS